MSDQVLTNTSYACTMTSIMADLTPDHLHELFAFFEMHNPQSLEQINEEIARDGQAVVGTPTTLRPEEEALCIC